MVEIKLSQGAKPGHGGIFPAAKLTPEIAAIRHVEMGADVISPAAHSAFTSPIGLLKFVTQLRELNGGKPVGFKLCIGHRAEFLSICKAMVETGITPDFITIDGSEGGTGAAPIELINSVGTPLREGISFAHNALRGFGLRDQVRLIGAGKVLSAFHLFRVLALGCIRSMSCNTDKCPTGVATQNPSRYRSLDVSSKGQRVANYQTSMIRHLIELLEVAGLDRLEDIRPHQINHRIGGAEVKSFSELHPQLEPGCLLKEPDVPSELLLAWQLSRADCWHS